jgi:hypothetical protein
MDQNAGRRRFLGTTVMKLESIFSTSTCGAFTADEVLLTSLGHHTLDLITDTWFRMPDIDENDGATVQDLRRRRTVLVRLRGALRETDLAGDLLGDARLWTANRDRATGGARCQGDAMPWPARGFLWCLHLWCRPLPSPR